MRTILRVLPILALALLAAGCLPGGGTGFSSQSTRVDTPMPARAEAEVIGQGAVRVAVLLPRSAAGNAGATARAYRNAIELATRDLPDAGVEYRVYDTGGTPEGARAVAVQAVDEGAELVLGPLFADNVRSAGPYLRQAGVPVIAFSSDSTVASPGVYLLSFFPEDNIRTVVAYAGSKGRRAFAALLPNNAFGNLAEASFRTAAARAGGRVVAVERYTDAADAATKVANLSASAGAFDALLVPEPEIAAGVAQAVGSDVLVLGSGQWERSRALASPSLRGAVFAAPGPGFESFSSRYAAAYGTAPPRITSIAYDAAVLAANLPRFGASRYSAGTLTGASGFLGTDGVFRFRNSGENERRLAIYEVTGSGARILVPAPRDFSSRGF